MKRKFSTIGIVLLLVGLSLIPSTLSKQILSKTIITVDDEPGDADYTSIREAINHSNPGDTIAIYSGTYNETNITLEKQDLSIIGIPHELGTGNDTGKPIINVTSYSLDEIVVAADHITINGLVIYWIYGPTIQVKNADDFSLISTDFPYGGGILIESANRTIIRNNTINDYLYLEIKKSHDCIIENNTIHVNEETQSIFLNGSNFTFTRNCIDGGGIQTDIVNNLTITHNIIRNSKDAGLEVGLGQNVIDSNEFSNNIVGLSLLSIRYPCSVQVTNNNFLHNMINIVFMKKLSRAHLVFDHNYYGRCHLLPKPILGFGIIILWRFEAIFELPVPLPYPLIRFDWHPARTPNPVP